MVTLSTLLTAAAVQLVQPLPCMAKQRVNSQRSHWCTHSTIWTRSMYICRCLRVAECGRFHPSCSSSTQTGPHRLSWVREVLPHWYQRRKVLRSTNHIHVIIHDCSIASGWCRWLIGPGEKRAPRAVKHANCILLMELRMKISCYHQ
jgi:hypothetical protein